MRRFLLFLVAAPLLISPLLAQGLQDAGQRTNPIIGSVTPQAFNGSGSPGAIPGNLSGDTYTDFSTSPRVGYLCGAAPGTPPPACGAVTAGQWQMNASTALYQYDVVENYHASGSAARTIGTIAANSNSLSIFNAATFSVGEGIYIAGAVTPTTQNPAGNLITTITAIAGTTFTLAANATVAVSGAQVQHDDTAAINTAIAAAFSAGGGLVWLRASGVDGVYRCNAVANASTGGVLTFPQNLVYSGGPIPVALIGEFPTIDLDFSQAPNVAGTSAISTAPYVAANSGNYATIFEPVNVIVDNFGVNLPAQSKLNGLMFSNAEQARVGDYVTVAAAPDVASPCCTWNQPTGNSTGIWMPQAFNNVIVNIGSAKVAFMNHCLVPGEHMRMGKPYLYGCNVPLYLYAISHQVYGEVTIESSPVMVQVDAGVTSDVPVDIKIDGEGYGSSWMTRGSYEIDDTGSHLTGTVAYVYFASGPGANGMQFFKRNGALNVRLINSQSIALYGASGYPLPACNANLQNDKEVVYDALSPTYLGTYVSGGTVTVPVLCNGTNWVTH